jgi:quercetin dioxygenase-like cupin family protein
MINDILKNLSITKENSNTNIPNHNYKPNFHQKYKLNEIIYTVILRGIDNDNKYSLVEMIFPPDKEKEIPLHKHERENIIMYIIEGTFLIRYGNEEINGIPGMVLKFEKNIAHSYKKVGTKGGKLLMLYAPGGLENYFSDLNSSSIKGDLQVLDDDDRVTLHLLEKNYGWTFNM